MDVVAAQIDAIGGKLDLITHQGQGTTFILELPAPQMLVSCILLRVGNRQVAIPSEEIVATALLDNLSPQANVPESIAAWRLQTDEGEALGFDLADYWPSNSPRQERAISELAIALRVRASSVWSIADELLGRVELSISPLPAPLVPPVGFLGVSLQPDGKLISVLDPSALAAAIADNPNHRPNPPVISPPDASNRNSKSILKSILIVDDAALMRRRLEASLKRYGYDIATCSDGLEALDWVQTHGAPSLMITDVEMPNMDGFTLIDRLRQAGRDFPILVVSSRTAEDWIKEARRLGANDYLNKGFTTNHLVEKVESLLLSLRI
jgi:CheY-like chemotaxis protein